MFSWMFQRSLPDVLIMNVLEKNQCDVHLGVPEKG